MSNYSGVIKALEELQQYLSDQLPPLMVADSIETLAKQPPSITVSGIQSWIAGLTKISRNIAYSDYLYHAVSKLNMIQEYKLAPEGYSTFLAGIKTHVLEVCPYEERERLQQNMELIGISSVIPGASTVPTLQRPVGSNPAEESLSAPKESDFRNFDYMIARLERHLSSLGTGASHALKNRDEIVTDTLSEAARMAQHNVEWKQVLGSFRQIGLQVKADDVFRSLGQTLPGWTLPGRSDLALQKHSNLLAMHRLISRADDRDEAANHFHHLVQAATERFNEGQLPQAAAMYRLASGIVERREVPEHYVSQLIGHGHENLSEDKLRTYADTAQNHGLLLTVLNFYPAFTPKGLLDSLYACSKRDQRKLLLLLMETHGEAARKLCLAELQKAVLANLPDSEVWYRRNLIYLLRRIPMCADEPLEKTVETVLQYADLNQSSLILKETIAYLPQLKHEKVEAALKRLLSQLDIEISQPGGDRKEQQQLLDRTVSALCRMGTKKAHKAVIDHVFKKKAEPQSLARLSDLSGFDLSKDDDVLSPLLSALAANTPPRRMGLILHQKDRNAKFIVKALSGTLHPTVRELLQELAHRHGDTESGIAASAALLKLEELRQSEHKQDVRSPSLAGDLELFGLPGLAQNLADSRLTGLLTLHSLEGETFGTLALLNGKFRSCRVGQLTGDSAFYQLIEKPQSGTFQFVKALQTHTVNDSELPDILSMILEGMSRYDELQQMRAQIPEDVRFVLKSVRPTCHPDEKDGLLFRDVWTAIQNNATPLQLESAVLTDSFRIYRLLSHWISSDAIHPADPL